ncbi:hypothetical protein PT974_04831 [Cladobotryum mycophilum]|uniref:Uncharacterized protein n=1 Tax=Cladobotryum mycophilum TaxID=491253 RepID=A0ABR0SQB0_9HYPO
MPPRPAPSDPDVILPASHEITKTLLAWTRVCRATAPLASKFLRQHCTHIDSYKKLQSLVRCLGRSAHRVDQYGQPNVNTPTQMYLSPFLDDDYDTIPAPLNDLPTAKSVHDLFFLVAPTLRRLIVNMPLRSLYPDDDYDGIRPLLRKGFEALVNIEEFVSLQDGLFLRLGPRSRNEPEVWATCWPKLRRLSLYNVDIDPDRPLFSSMANVPHLESVIFPRLDGLSDWRVVDINGRNLGFSIDVKLEWLKALVGRDIYPFGEPKRPQDISIMFVNTAQQEASFSIHQDGWQDMDPEGRIRVKLYDVDEYEYEKLNEIENVHEFLKQRALNGTLFDPELGKLVGRPRIV